MRSRVRAKKLCRALKASNWNKAERLLNAIGSQRIPNILLANNETILYVAAEHKAPSAIIEKILKTVDVDFCFQTNVVGENPLHQACEFPADMTVVRLLALKRPQAFFEMDAQDQSPFDILINAPVRQDSMIALLLTDVAAAWPVGIRQTNRRGEYLLHRAVPATYEDFPIAQAILSISPGQIESRDNEGATPIHTAARQKDDDAARRIEFLLEYASGPEVLGYSMTNGNTPLHEACPKRPIRSVIELLVTQFPDAIQIRNMRGKTPLDLFRAEFCWYAPYLLEYHGNISDMAMILMTGSRPQSPSLHSLLRHPQCTYDVAQYFVWGLRSQASFQDPDGDLPLHFIAQAPTTSARDHVFYRQIVTVLVRAFPDASHIPNHEGMLPLQLMVRSGKSWNTGIRPVFLQHPAAVQDLGLPSHAVCKLLERVGSDIDTNHVFQLLKNAPDLLQCTRW